MNEFNYSAFHREKMEIKYIYIFTHAKLSQYKMSIIIYKNTMVKTSAKTGLLVLYHSVRSGREACDVGADHVKEQ